ncbi:DNA-binding protein [Massilia eurypsychrophila]|jgi:predicted transcriptional regulator YheO|uniref:DNA-binding protein n=1 Tax=Massilia eurypsychrophila TaxID=1485217 RepID=A0A2G8TCJ6_9BURK|nr:PAS domain-containing protein [Massilia eurypsychrophila]PIL43723.1 DNA-binding protein [Massilia eurypsychrophila]
MIKRTPEQRALLEQMEQIAIGLGKAFAPFCEVVVHDLLDPSHAIVAIQNNLSGRAIGQEATELGLARIADPSFPQVLASYANQFADGRQVKSTSIGIKDSGGKYVAALCLNMDLTPFRSMQQVMQQFVHIHDQSGVEESLAPSGTEAIRQHIDQFAASCATTPRALKAEERRLMMRELKGLGLLEVRRSMETVAQHLGVSRATVYKDAA